MTKLPPAFLYIGGSYPQLAAIRSLRQLGFFVVVTDINADAPARDDADLFAQIGAHEVERILELAEMVSESHTLAGVYGVADYAFDAVLGVARGFALKGPRCEAGDLLTDKAKTNARLRARGLPVPELHWIGEDGPDDWLISSLAGRNVVVKARSLNNSKSVIPLRVARADEIKQAIRKVAAAGGGIMIEALVTGSVGNVDGLMLAGKFYPISTTIRHNDPDVPAVCTAMIQPGGVPEYEKLVFALADQAAKALGYETGPFTVDLIIGDKAEIFILEVSPHFHNITCEIARGNGNPMAAYASWLREDANWNLHLPRGTARHGFLYQKFVEGEGVITAILGLDELSKWPCHIDTRVFSNVGDRVASSADRKNLLCLVWAASDKREDIDNVLKFIEHDVRAVVEAPTS